MNTNDSLGDQEHYDKWVCKIIESDFRGANSNTLGPNFPGPNLPQQNFGGAQFAGAKVTREDNGIA